MPDSALSLETSSVEILKLSERAAPRVSLVLVDWSVRESFHIIDYLRRQGAPREAFEIIIVEYYDHRSPALEAYAEEVDSWILLRAPASALYHKHLMYNAGILAARGEIVMIGDSDAMVQESFIGAICQAFDENPDIVLHIDQFRNNRRDLYPFDNPTFAEILGEGCVNNADGQTAGLRDRSDPLHTRNYGACMAARRERLIEIGGADEHVDFCGHICGPYDLTFRLINAGLSEVWHRSEFTYHSWHPGAAGVDNYQGPHDGKQMSTTSLEALTAGRTRPLVENPGIRALRQGEALGPKALLERAVPQANFALWAEDGIKAAAAKPEWRMARYGTAPAKYRGYRIEQPVSGKGWGAQALCNPADSIEAETLPGLLRAIDRRSSTRMTLLGLFGAFYLAWDRVREKLIKEVMERLRRAP